MARAIPRRVFAGSIVFLATAVIAVVLFAYFRSERTQQPTTGRSSPSSTPSAPSFPVGTSIRSIAGSDVRLPPLPTGRVARVPSNIPANCSSDATRALQSWIDSTPDNTTLSFAPHACYRVDGTVILNNRARLRIEGNGATLRAFGNGNRTRAQLRLHASNDVTIQDLVIRGANAHAGANPGAYVAGLEAQHAFDLQGVDGVLLFQVQAYDLYGDFVYVGAAANRPSRDVTISHALFERSGRQGISITGGVNVAVADNVIGGAARSLFDVEANTTKTSIRHILFLRNITGAARNFWLANKGRDASIGDLTFAGNRMVARTRGLVFVFGTGQSIRGPFLFAGNEFAAAGQLSDEGSSGAFFFANARDVTIRDNTVSFAPGMTAVELRGSHGVTVTGNRFSGQRSLVLATDGSSDYHVS